LDGDITMRFELVRNLKGVETLSRAILDSDGNVLLVPGTILTRSYINKLRRHGIFSVYVKDSILEDIKQDQQILELKQTALKALPNIFRGLAMGSREAYYDSYHALRDLVDYIIEEGNIHTNLFEINKYDNYTYIHCVDTSIMAAFLGLSLNLDKDSLRTLGEAAILHDIGKLQISDKIIGKKGKLTSEEYEEIKKHPLYGFNMLNKAGINNEFVLFGVLQHHERIDGKGYPYGKGGQDISTYAKIISLCDVFTALSANRSYRDRFEPNEAYEYVLSNSGVMFCPNVVKKFREVFAIYPLGCCVKLSNGIEGYVIRQNKNFPDRPVIRVTYDFPSKKTISCFEIDLLEKLTLSITSVVS
jgi:putative nucleotidyltransferase with HDIG domain